MENKKLSYEELEAKLKELEQENAKLKTINSIFKDREQSEKYVWMHQQFKLRDFYLENKYWFLRLLDSKVVQKDNVISIENVNGNFPIYLTEEERRSAIQDLAKYIDQKTYQFDTNPKIDYLYTVFDNLCSLYITHGLICNGGIKENIMQMRGIREFSYDSYLPFYHDFAAIYKALEKIEDDEIKMEIIEKLIPIVVSEVYADNKSLRAVERDGIMYHLNDRANFENWAFRRAESGKKLGELEEWKYYSSMYDDIATVKRIQIAEDKDDAIEYFKNISTIKIKRMFSSMENSPTMYYLSKYNEHQKQKSFAKFIKNVIADQKNSDDWEDSHTLAEHAVFLLEGLKIVDNKKQMAQDEYEEDQRPIDEETIIEFANYIKSLPSFIQNLPMDLNKNYFTNKSHDDEDADEMDDEDSVEEEQNQGYTDDNEGRIAAMEQKLKDIDSLVGEVINSEEYEKFRVFITNVAKDQKNVMKDPFKKRLIQFGFELSRIPDDEPAENHPDYKLGDFTPSEIRSFIFGADIAITGYLFLDTDKDYFDPDMFKEDDDSDDDGMEPK